ncbi:hypothetical protein TVAG_013930 [Trichomonas vaginalis G3]|uniref:GPI mannosyltransferase 2 n=1 Tax=Trichomonas vaginalis (strain ATCC PRA-98 / G3) TaxID=412133 RepID=A2DDE7_TRIV3|nr:dolichyl-phosphate-mannose-glycolipid alpha-mannosyltransferase protein [Trichomonas vaginalis G3]EAY21626.1 hypothetical protein TVAG_013930 [Trichomonas vaginalis G3]KAI5489698.1 dolichyl-phosphate-mannose-glycolipid alpha-mannosyltransferase protein [Trichomonas vaginalis G3]|eukprot:XP_001582612.1 hypothetical protein [Trichomonas vaginalis G3]
MLQDFRSTWSRFYNSVAETTPVPDKFWHPDLEDAKCLATMYLVTFSIWLSAMLTDGPLAILKYWDGPNYIYVGITLYDSGTKVDPWKRTFSYPYYYIACHLPGYPLIIKLMSFFTFGHWALASYLSILFSTGLLVYAFRRLLIIYDCVNNPTLTTMLLSVIPTRFMIYHSVIASEPTFLAFVCLSLIFYKIQNIPLMMTCVWYCCITRIEGISIGATIGLCYLLRLDIAHALMMFTTFLADFALLIMHKKLFNEWLAYFKFNFSHQGLISWPPLYKLIGSAGFTDMVEINTFLLYFLLLTPGVILLYGRCGPVAIFASIFNAYVTILFHIDIYRYGIPGSVFSFLIGYDRLWSSSQIQNTLLASGLPLIVLLLTYAAGQIMTNVCGNDFLEYVFSFARSEYL